MSEATARGYVTVNPTYVGADIKAPPPDTTGTSAVLKHSTDATKGSLDPVQYRSRAAQASVALPVGTQAQAEPGGQGTDLGRAEQRRARAVAGRPRHEKSRWPQYGQAPAPLRR